MQLSIYSANLPQQKPNPQVFVLQRPFPGLTAGYREFQPTKSAMAGVWKRLQPKSPGQLRKSYSVTQGNLDVFFTFAALYDGIRQQMSKEGIFLQRLDGTIVGAEISSVSEETACDGCAVPTYKESLHADVMNLFAASAFAYPVLMAADILIYDSNVVPVGQDQKQHVEITRDIAIKFNEQYGQTFVLPEAQIRAGVAKVPGLDGEKMSKSYGNTIEIFGEEKAQRKKVMGIKMDSRTPQEPKPDADQNLAIQLLKLVAPADVAKDYESRLRAGGLGYGDLKKALFESYWSCFETARKKRAELEANLGFVNEVLANGADKACQVARKTLARARLAAGLD